VGTACTNGEKVRVSPDYLDRLSFEEQACLLAHEALHCALRHCIRGQPLIKSDGDAKRFNHAADIVVNGALARAGMTLPSGCIRDTELEHLSVEEIYQLLDSSPPHRFMPRDIGERLRDLDMPLGSSPSTLVQPQASTIDWNQVIRQAEVLCRVQGGRGSHGLGLRSDLKTALGDAQVDWRTILWRILASSPNDWRGWDRRGIWKQAYTPTLTGTRLRAVVGIDTSGSISRSLLRIFLSELEGILRAIEHLEIDLYWTDTALYGPIRLHSRSEVLELTPEGGGGTDLAPLFHRARELAETEGTAPIPVIYLTDGLGPTLEAEPDGLQTLWVIPRGGRTRQPFGEVVSLENSR
jgi:predicted metal-dependent peptidase